MTALQRDPDKRWQNAAAMREALRGAARAIGTASGTEIREWVQWAFTREPWRDSIVVRLVETLEPTRASRPRLLAAVLQIPAPQTPAPRARGTVAPRESAPMLIVSTPGDATLLAARAMAATQRVPFVPALAPPPMRARGTAREPVPMLVIAPSTAPRETRRRSPTTSTRFGAAAEHAVPPTDADLDPAPTDPQPLQALASC